MRKVSFAINISLDGVCDHTLFNPNPEIHEYFTEVMNEVDLIFFGRIMYQLMFPYWANVARDKSGTYDENKFAEKITSISRVVVSRSLTTSDENTRIVRANPAEELLQLKQLPGKTISVDSISMLPELIAAGLIDEFKLMIHPVILGNGRRLLDTGNLQEKLDLKLIETINFKSGCVALHYLKK
ncbi:deaminase [Mucilaginibacter terrenus]|uniref:Deaminase n=1 Tax=Mucilaginibacter terrenus TaxID=2482727 RepID=A0A3E2NV79_9SPHI|nr:dihydrofolate reductase family protein [Mucilaginibacter terrenus]RFZ84821.1 deaminase [Mucilaginibacter terrenus]